MIATAADREIFNPVCTRYTIATFSLTTYYSSTSERNHKSSKEKFGEKEGLGGS